MRQSNNNDYERTRQKKVTFKYFLVNSATNFLALAIKRASLLTMFILKFKCGIKVKTGNKYEKFYAKNDLAGLLMA